MPKPWSYVAFQRLQPGPPNWQTREEVLEDITRVTRHSLYIIYTHLREGITRLSLYSVYIYIYTYIYISTVHDSTHLHKGGSQTNLPSAALVDIRTKSPKLYVPVVRLASRCLMTLQLNSKLIEKCVCTIKDTVIPIPHVDSRSPMCDVIN